MERQRARAKGLTMTTFLSRILAIVAVLALILSACSSDGTDSTSAGDEGDTTATTAEATATNTADDAAGDGDNTDSAMDDTAMDDTAVDDTAVDDTEMEDDAEQGTDSTDSSDEGATSSEDESVGDDELAAMLPFFGVNDPAATATCVREEAANEGMTIDTLMAGDGSPMMVAVVRCSPEEVRASFAVEFGDIDSSAIAANPGQIECAFDSMLEFIADIDLADAEGVLSGDAPDELVEKLVGDCDISSADADFLLNEA